MLQSCRLDLVIVIDTRQEASDVEYRQVIAEMKASGDADQYIAGLLDQIAAGSLPDLLVKDADQFITGSQYLKYREDYVPVTTEKDKFKLFKTIGWLGNRYPMLMLVNDVDKGYSSSNWYEIKYQDLSVVDFNNEAFVNYCLRKLGEAAVIRQLFEGYLARCGRTHTFIDSTTLEELAEICVRQRHFAFFLVEKLTGYDRYDCYKNYNNEDDWIVAKSAAIKLYVESVRYYQRQMAGDKRFSIDEPYLRIVGNLRFL